MNWKQLVRVGIGHLLRRQHPVLENNDQVKVDSSVGPPSDLTEEKQKMWMNVLGEMELHL